MTRVLMTALALALMFPGPGWAATAPGSALILHGVRVVDPESARITGPRSLLIIDGRIAEIAGGASAGWPGNAQAPEVKDLYATPALFDAHVHVFDERDLAMYATFGIAGIRNMDGWGWHLALDDPECPAPGPSVALFSTGSQIQKRQGLDVDRLPGLLAREQAAGHDWIKLYDDLDSNWLSIIAAHRRDGGQRVTGHLPGGLDATRVLAKVVYDDIAHAEELLSAMKREFGDWRQGLDTVAGLMVGGNVALTTTLVSNQMIAEQASGFEQNLSRDEVRYAPPLLQAFWQSGFNPYAGQGQDADSLHALVGQLLELVAGLHQRGVLVIAGTDAPNPTTVPGVSLHQELQLLVEAGLSPTEALRTATTLAADYLAPGAGLGRIRPGAPANFMLTSADPLTDLAVLRRPKGLVRDGHYLSQGQVQQERETLARSYQQDLEILNSMNPQSADAVIQAMGPPEEARLSREGLTSLIWMYQKFGNHAEARRLADMLQRRFPGCRTQTVRLLAEPARSAHHH